MNSTRKISAALLLLFTVPVAALGATSTTSFESFYIPDWHLPWWGWILAGLAAAIAALAVYFSFGTASGPVAAIGSAIGSWMGLSGAAATSAGLALLGGGSLAAGGLGMAGGAAVITAALTFSSEVVSEYAINYALREVSLRQLHAQSSQLLTLPPPANKKGSSAYQESMERLKDYDPKLPLSSSDNQSKLQEALKVAREKAPTTLKPEDSAQIETLVALLHFQLNEYDEAFQHASQALAIAESTDTKAAGTLPSFIYAVSSLYNDQFNGAVVVNEYFRRSVVDEPNNPLLPLLFSIFLERSLYRFEEGAITSENLKAIVQTVGDESIKSEKARAASLVVVGMRLLVEIKKLQQDIYAISKSNSRAVTSSPKTVSVLQRRLASYKRLLPVLEQGLLPEYQRYDNLLKRQERGLRRSGVLSEGDELIDATKLRELVSSYVADIHNLESAISQFKMKQWRNGPQPRILIPILVIVAFLLLIAFKKRQSNKATS